MDVDDVSLVRDELMIEIVKELDPATVQRIKELKVSECPICREAAHSSTVLTPCGHSSCKRCLAQMFNIPTHNYNGRKDECNFKCPVCQSNFNVDECFSYEAFQTVHMPESLADRTDEEDGADEEEYGTGRKNDEVDDGIADAKCESDEEQAKMKNREGIVMSLLDDGFFDSENEYDEKHAQSTVSNVRKEKLREARVRKVFMAPLQRNARSLCWWPITKKMQD